MIGSKYELKKRGQYLPNSPYVTGAWVTGKRSRKLPQPQFIPEPVPSKLIRPLPANGRLAAAIQANPTGRRMPRNQFLRYNADTGRYEPYSPQAWEDSEDYGLAEEQRGSF